MADLMRGTAIVAPRRYGLQTYTDEQLREHAKALVGSNLYRGDGKDPAHIVRTEIVPEGVLAHFRVWRVGDRARNPETGSLGTVRRGVVSGSLFAGFIEGYRSLGGKIQPVSEEG